MPFGLFFLWKLVGFLWMFGFFATSVTSCLFLPCSFLLLVFFLFSRQCPTQTILFSRDPSVFSTFQASGLRKGRPFPCLSCDPPPTPPPTGISRMEKRRRFSREPRVSYPGGKRGAVSSRERRSMYSEFRAMEKKKKKKGDERPFSLRREGESFFGALGKGGGPP